MLMNPQPPALSFSQETNDAILEVKIMAILCDPPISLHHSRITKVLGGGGDLEIPIRDVCVGKIRSDAVVMFLEISSSAVSHEVVIHDLGDVVPFLPCVGVLVEDMIAIVLP